MFVKHVLPQRRQTSLPNMRTVDRMMHELMLGNHNHIIELKKSIANDCVIPHHCKPFSPIFQDLSMYIARGWGWVDFHGVNGVNLSITVGFHHSDHLLKVSEKLLLTLISY